MKPRTFYNEFDRTAAQWLRNLGQAGYISPGHVEEKSIAKLTPKDLKGFTRAHFFAGIAGWDLALQLIGWPQDVPVWTGSCPCQPFSNAGKRKGVADERHLWPVWFQLIKKCRPPTIFGEQVASAAGRLWLSGVRADMESLGYAFGAADLCAAGVSAPHLRQRLWWVAYAPSQRLHRLKAWAKSPGGGSLKEAVLWLDHAPSKGLPKRSGKPLPQAHPRRQP